MSIERWRFTVRHRIFGYRRPRDHGSNYKAYLKFKDNVRVYALAVGFRSDVRPGNGGDVYRLSVFPRWNRLPRSDWSNVFKAIEDALFSFDRYIVPGPECDMVYKTGEPDEIRVLVERIPRAVAT
jgi:hypothetical protein